MPTKHVKVNNTKSRGQRQRRQNDMCDLERQTSHCERKRTKTIISTCIDWLSLRKRCSMKLCHGEIRLPLNINVHVPNQDAPDRLQAPMKLKAAVARCHRHQKLFDEKSNRCDGKPEQNGFECFRKWSLDRTKTRDLPNFLLSSLMTIFPFFSTLQRHILAFIPVCVIYYNQSYISV